MLGSSTISGSLCLHLFDKYHFSFLITNIVTSHHLKPETVGILLDDQLDVPTGYFMIYLLYLYHELKNSRSLLFLNDLAYTFTVIIFVGWLVGGQEKDEPSFTQNYLYLYACGWLPFMYPWWMVIWIDVMFIEYVYCLVNLILKLYRDEKQWFPYQKLTFVSYINAWEGGSYKHLFEIIYLIE